MKELNLTDCKQFAGRLQGRAGTAAGLYGSIVFDLGPQVGHG